jgi:hypothetical protein
MGAYPIEWLPCGWVDQDLQLWIEGKVVHHIDIGQRRFDVGDALDNLRYGDIVCIADNGSVTRSRASKLFRWRRPWNRRQIDVIWE